MSGARSLFAAVSLLALPVAMSQTVGQGVLAAALSHKLGGYAARQADDFRLRTQREHVSQAMVLVDNRSCAGFVAHRSDLTVTAAHCIGEDVRGTTIQTRDGKRLHARLEHIDRDSDLALLALERPLAVTPLSLADEVPAVGSSLMFVGRFDRGSRAQRARLKKLGRCPSLPKVADALFTSIDARPGDSGAPVLDDRLRVVGLVHGGARCHIAAPVAPLARQLKEDHGPPRVLAQSLRD
jgi:S1-C subfamily serine protease